MQVLVMTNSMNRDDVPMIKPRDRPRFATEPLDHSGAGQQRGRHDLDCDLAIQGYFASKVDGGHSTCADLAQDLELTRDGNAKPTEDAFPGNAYVISHGQGA